MKRIIILAFDLKGESWAIRKKIWRALQEIEAELKYKSHWILPYSNKNLADMRLVCNEIRKYGGKAEVIIGEKVA